MEVTKNFKWEETARKAVLFLPNYKVSKYVRASIEHLQTVAEPHTYLIVVANDGCHDDFKDLYHKNVRYMTFHRENDEPRNGLFVRNYFIKRCLSEILIQKDGEVIIEGDMIFAAQHSGHLVRPGKIRVLNQSETDSFFKNDNFSDVNIESGSIKIEPVRPITDLEKVREHLLALDGQRNFISYYHYCYSCPTAQLRGLNGYDENYRYYGWEDVDMYLRLSRVNRVIEPHYDIYAIHPMHPSTVNGKELPNMAGVFRDSDLDTVTRNPDKNWGEGE